MAIFKVYDGTDWIEVPILDPLSIPFTPAVVGDWDGAADPGDVNDALDQLAERVDDLETVTVWLPVVAHVDAIQERADDFPTVKMDSSQKTEISWAVPETWVSTTEVLLLVYPDATETLTIDFDIASIAPGEALDANATSSQNQTKAVTANQLTEWDITSLLPTVAAGDYLGFRMDSDTDNIRVIGIRIRYVRT